MSRSPEIERLKRERKPGTCIACDGPLPPRKARPQAHGGVLTGKRRVICRDPECASLYQIIYQLDRRQGLTVRP